MHALCKLLVITGSCRAARHSSWLCRLYLLTLPCCAGGTFSLFKSFLPLKCNVTTTFVPINDIAAVATAITPNTRAIYTETQSNPMLVASDLPRLAELAHSRGIKLVVSLDLSPDGVV